MENSTDSLSTEYEELLRIESELLVKADNGKCPQATQDIKVNLANRKKAIDTASYGPLNPAEPNTEYWSKLAKEWDVDTQTAKKQRCGNCAVFIVTPEMKSCIQSGLDPDNKDEWGAIDAAGQLGYCEAFDFKCASKRTCRAWVTGGPITSNVKQKSDEEDVEYAEDVNNPLAVETVDEISSRSMIELKYLEFQPLYDEYYGSRLVNTFHIPNELLLGKAAKNRPVLRDPKGGLTAAGRRHFKRTEGANLKPGVKGPANTPEKMRRKGSFLTRFFTNPSGPMKDEKGRATRLALSAAAWGEPVPQNAEDAARLAAKGRRLLDRYSKIKKKSDIQDFSMSIKSIFSSDNGIEFSGDYGDDMNGLVSTKSAPNTIAMFIDEPAPAITSRRRKLAREQLAEYAFAQKSVGDAYIPGNRQEMKRVNIAILFMHNKRTN